MQLVLVLGRVTTHGHTRLNIHQDATWQLGAKNGSKKKEGRDAMRWLVVRNGSIEGRVPVDPVDPIGGCLQGTKSRATHPQRIIRAWLYAYHRHHHHHCHRRHHRLHRHYYDIANIWYTPLKEINYHAPWCQYHKNNVSDSDLDHHVFHCQYFHSRDPHQH